MESDQIKIIIEQFVDYLLPVLNPYETSLYLYLFRNSFLKSDSGEIRIGKRTIASEFGKGGPQGKKINPTTVANTLKKLEEKRCIDIGETNRDGTLYVVKLPENIPLVAEKIASLLPQDTEEDYFNDPEKRREIFERDKWICQYCGEKLTLKNSTLDHCIPQCKGGNNSKENLKTCCLICNSIKAGKTYEEAAPLLLKSIQERRTRSLNV